MPSSHHQRYASGGSAVLALLILMTAVPSASAQVALADDPMVQMRQRQFETQKTNAARLQKLDVASIKEVINLRLIDGKELTVETPRLDEMPDRNPTTSYRLELKDLSGLTTLQAGPVLNLPIPRQVAAPPNGAAPNAPAQVVVELQRIRIFTMTHQAIPKPDEFVEITIRSDPSSLTISQRKYFSGGELRLDFEVAQGMGLRTRPGVSFRVYQRKTGEKSESVRLQEADFATLLRAHPVEAERYIRPLLTDLGQRELVGVENAVAFQVLADQLSADEATQKQVSEMLPVLDDADFRVREKAVDALKKVGPLGVMALRKVDRKKLSPEQNRVVDLLLSPYNQLTQKEAQHLRTDLSFLLGCLGSDDLQIRTAAFNQLKKVTEKPDLKYDPAASAEERTASISELRLNLLSERH